MNTTIEFLKTGGVPLTNDLMDVLQNTYKIFDVLADLSGSKTILSGCEVIGSNVSPGVVAINGEVLPFEGGLLSSTVYIFQEEISEVFQDQVNKVLIKKRSVRMGNSVVSYPWSDFKRLDTLISLKENIETRALQSDLDIALADIEILKMKTAPIVNNGIVMIWPRTEPIPPFWKECQKLRGRTPIGYDPDYVYNAAIHAINYKLNEKGAQVGELQHQLTIAEMARHRHSGQSLVYAEVWKGNGFKPDDYNNEDGFTDYQGDDKPHNNVQPSEVVVYIEPNFPL